MRPPAPSEEYNADKTAGAPQPQIMRPRRTAEIDEDHFPAPGERSLSAFDPEDCSSPDRGEEDREGTIPHKKMHYPGIRGALHCQRRILSQKRDLIREIDNDMTEENNR